MPLSQPTATSASALTLVFDSTLSGDTASFDVTSISGSFYHLEIIADLRSTEAATQSDICVRLNNDSGASQYDAQYFYVLGNATTGVTANANATSCFVGLTCGDSATSGRSGALRLLIPNYAGTTYHKNLKSETAYVRGASLPQDDITTHGGGVWKSTSAVTRVTVLPASGNWKAGSRLTIYGRS